MLWFSFFVCAFHCLLNGNWSFFAFKQAPLTDFYIISYHIISWDWDNWNTVYSLIFPTLTTIFFSHIFFWIYCVAPTVPLLDKADHPSFQVSITRPDKHCLNLQVNLEHLQLPFSKSEFIYSPEHIIYRASIANIKRRQSDAMWIKIAIIFGFAHTDLGIWILYWRIHRRY